VFEARKEKTRPGLVYCANGKGAKETIAGLIRDAGFDLVDAEPLRVARYTKPFALLIGELAYGGNGGPELAYRFERFGPVVIGRDRLGGRILCHELFHL
jgi:8-hydroxy-5-deazaflavin:NADPH oxidoreductase